MATFNVEGFRRNSLYLWQIINELSPKLLFLQEVWVPYSEEQSINDVFKDYSVQISTPDQFTPPEDMLGRGEHIWHGAAIMWHESMNSNVLGVANTHERFTGIKLSFSEEYILAISAYLPTSGRDDDFLSCLAELSNFISENNDQNGTVLIGMDSNCSEKSTSRRILGFQQFCWENNLLKVCHSAPTFHHSNGTSESNIDYFLITKSSSTRLNSIFSQCNLDYPQNFSSHDPVFTTVTVPSSDQSTKKEKYSHTYSAFAPSRVVWTEDNLSEYQRTAAKVLSEFEEFLPAPELIPLKCKLYSELLVKAAEICFETKQPKATKKARHPQQLHHAWKHLEKCFNTWKREGKPRGSLHQSHKLYRQARGHFQHIRRYGSNLKTIKFNNLLMETHRSDKMKHFKLMRSLRGSHSKQTLTTLHTPAGSYYGSDTLEWFARDA